MRSNWLLEITKRAQSGPYIKESEFDLKVAKRIKELVKEKGIKYDPNVLCPADDDLADRVWEAGLQLFLEFGAYCQTTERLHPLHPRRGARHPVRGAQRDHPRRRQGRGGDAPSRRRGCGHAADHAFRPHRHARLGALSSADPALVRAGAAGRLPGRRLGVHLLRREDHPRHAAGDPRRAARCQRGARGGAHGRTARHAHQRCRRVRSPAPARWPPAIRRPVCAPPTASWCRRWWS